eukprot:TRINITY_DN16118_c0_g1_i1.p1 TRINITY_DN16118_c0_g1~~TRINITY_DN16118_c0_g1_i1.p1  ORF type:complete len:890 (+),score=205.19 TRINITY_DN16118_c0_g1_i1:44-2671(+)
MSSDLPPELLNAVNKKLKTEVEAKERKLATLQKEMAKESHLIEKNTKGKQKHESEIRSLKIALDLKDAERTSEEDFLQKATREASKMLKDSEKAKTRYTELKTQTHQKSTSVKKCKMAISTFLKQNKISEEKLQELINKQGSKESIADALSQMSAETTKKYNNLIDKRDSLSTAANEARLNLLTETKNLDIIHNELQKTLTDMHTAHTERKTVLEQYRSAVLMTQNLEDRLKTAATESKKMESVTINAEQRLKDYELQLKNHNEENTSIEAKCLKTQEQIDKIRSVNMSRQTEADDLDALKASLQTELARAARQLDETRREIDGKKQEIERNKNNLLQSEHDLLQAAEQLASIESHKDNEDKLLKNIDDMRKNFIARLNKSIKTVRAYEKTISEESQILETAGEAATELETRVATLQRHGRKTRQDLTAARKRLTEYTSIDAGLKASKEARENRLLDMKDQLKSYKKDLLDQAVALQEALQQRQIATGPIAAGLISIQAKLSQASGELSEASEEIKQRNEELKLTEADVAATSAKIARNLLKKKEKEKAAKLVKCTEEKTRGQLSMVLHDVETEEIHQVNLHNEVGERLAAVSTHHDDLKHTLRTVEEERRSLGIELQEKQTTVTQLKTRYNEIMKAVHTAGAILDEDATPLNEGEHNDKRDEDLENMGPEEIHARYIANSASIRMRLQAYGDNLDKQLVEAERDDRRLQKMMEKMGVAHHDKKSKLATLAWDNPTVCEELAVIDGSPDRELAALRESCKNLKTEIAFYTRDIDEKTKRLRRLKSKKRPLLSLQRWALTASKTDRSVYGVYRRVLEANGLAPELVRTASRPAKNRSSSARPMGAVGRKPLAPCKTAVSVQNQSKMFMLTGRHVGC